MRADKQIQILLVEDNPDDVLLIAEVLRETGQSTSRWRAAPTFRRARS